MHFNESWYQYVRELQDTSSAFFIRAFCTSSLCIRKKTCALGDACCPTPASRPFCFLRTLLKMVKRMGFSAHVFLAVCVVVAFGKSRKLL